VEKAPKITVFWGQKELFKKILGPIFLIPFA
jgi:hypothetical protein